MGRRRGFFAELERAAREAERAQKRRHRELERIHREEAKEAKAHARERARADAEYAVSVYENHMGLLTSVHQQASAPISWDAVAASPPPEIVPPDTSNSQRVRDAMEVFRPSFLQRLFGGEKKARSKLQAELREALAEEEQRAVVARQDHESALADWKDTVELARRVVARDTSAYDQVIEESECLMELAELGCRAGIGWHNSDIAMVTLGIQGSDVVPTEVKSLTKAGKLSSKKMPQGLFWETYQDFVCGAALRAGRELLAVLPIETVLVNVTTRLLDTATGHEEPRTILSVFCVREQMGRINFGRADASDTTASFVHRMRFKRSKGLEPIDALDPSQSAFVHSQ